MYSHADIHVYLSGVSARIDIDISCSLFTVVIELSMYIILQTFVQCVVQVHKNIEACSDTLLNCYYTVEL